MKKLMIAAAAAAISAGASAESLQAQAYDVSLTVKTTTCKEIKTNRTIATLEGENYADADVRRTKVATRKQSSTKIAGVIWGCHCETIADPAWRTYAKGKTVGGYLFWEVGAEEVFDIRTTVFKWAVFDRIYKGDSAEGVWGLVNSDAEKTVGLIGAGFGKVDGLDCEVILKNMSGNFAGFYLAGVDAGGCKLCGTNGCGAWQICPCTSAFYEVDPAYGALTAAYGSWKIKYNKSASKKLKKTGLITRAGVFGKKSANAKEVMEKVEYAAEKDQFASAASDDDDEDSSLWPFDEQRDYDGDLKGEPIEKETIGTVAYSTGTYGTESYVAGDEAKPVETYDGENTLVSVLLALVDAS